LPPGVGPPPTSGRHVFSAQPFPALVKPIPDCLPGSQWMHFPVLFRSVESNPSRRMHIFTYEGVRKEVKRLRAGLRLAFEGPSSDCLHSKELITSAMVAGRLEGGDRPELGRLPILIPSACKNGR